MKQNKFNCVSTNSSIFWWNVPFKMLTVEMGELSLQGLFLVQEGNDDVQAIEYPQGEGHEFRGIRILGVDPVEELGGFWSELEETERKK